MDAQFDQVATTVGGTASAFPRTPLLRFAVDLLRTCRCHYFITSRRCGLFVVGLRPVVRQIESLQLVADLLRAFGYDTYDGSVYALSVHLSAGSRVQRHSRDVTARRVTSLLGNLAVVFIVWRERHMRTATNFFIVNLALCDVMVTSW